MRLSIQHSCRYPFPDCEREISRLVQQARLLKPLSEAFLSRACLMPGMRVLDIGCGTGAFTLSAATLVGASGIVVGVDRSVIAINKATDIAEQLGFTNVSYRVEDVEEMRFEKDFDVLMGRFILSYLKNPEGLLNRARNEMTTLSRMIFQEWQLDSPPPTMPFSKQIARYHEIILAALRSMGVDINMGLKLPRLLTGAIGWRTYAIEGRQHIGSATDEDLVEFLVATGRTLAERMTELGLPEVGQEIENQQVLALKELGQLQPTLSLNIVVGVAARPSSVEFEEHTATGTTRMISQDQRRL